ncbi:MAG: AAA family ATPase [Gammaproteobacteria bacterium]|nr:AAA family ATPase [Gammaproteobacteria bacterium]
MRRKRRRSRRTSAVSDYVRYLIFSYLDNIVGRVNRRQPEAAEIIEWIDDNGGLLDIDPEELPSRSESAPSARQWGQLRRIAILQREAMKHTARDLTARRLAELGDLVGLSPDDLAILEVVLRCETDPVIQDLIDASTRWAGLNLRNSSVATVLGVSAASVRLRFSAAAPLRRLGLIEVDTGQDVQCTKRLHRLTAEADDDADVRELLLGGTHESDLEWSDFDHLGQDRDHVESLLRGALERGAHGVNVLVHGEAGTGKTEFCRVLAARLGVQLFSAGEANEDGNEPTRRERMAELRLAQTLLGEDRSAVLLFDEMEDLLSPHEYGAFFRRGPFRGGDGSASKVFMNRLLEESSTPTLWTTNTAHGFDPAHLRRMTFAVEMRQPPPRIRARIWRRQLARHGIDATQEEAAALAREFDASPGVAAGATAAADLAAGDFDTVRRGVRSLSRVLGYERPLTKPLVRFDTKLIEADVDVEDLATRLTSTGERHFSICLQGPPGTGKSAYVRHLAERLDLEVLHKRASDLLGMWVGSTERNIARAFAEARDDTAFLVFDEADSLLADRREAVRGWEVSQVNEMLTWMESHPLPFACTTNFADRLDSAALRRFVFKVRLGYLKPEAAALAFRIFFGLEPPSGLRALSALTPADFEVVHRQASLLGQLKNPEALTLMLRAECAAKPGHRKTIGFVR